MLTFPMIKYEEKKDETKKNIATEMAFFLSIHLFTRTVRFSQFYIFRDGMI